MNYPFFAFFCSPRFLKQWTVAALFLMALTALSDARSQTSPSEVEDPAIAVTTEIEDFAEPLKAVSQQETLPLHAAF